MTTQPLGSVPAAIACDIAVLNVSAKLGAVVLDVLSFSFERFPPHSLPRHSINNRLGHKKECKRVHRELNAAMPMAAEGETETPAGSDVCPAVETNESNGNCDHCAAATPVAELLVCTGCTHARYCSLTCQHGAWFVRFF